MEMTTATAATMKARERLEALAQVSPMPIAEKMFNPFLYVRSSVLVKALVMDDLYRRIVNVPGALIEFGVWRGQNMVLLENLRAIHEPFNKGRNIVGFDTFDGYADGSYRAGPEYALHLMSLLDTHEGCNAFGHLMGHHRLIHGDVTETAPEFFKDFDGLVALACFDMGPEEPTKAALQAIWPHLYPGSVLLLDELAGGTLKAFRGMQHTSDYRIEKCALYPSKTIVTIQ